MHNLYGSRKLQPLEIKGSFSLPNGMYCVWGKPSDEGLSVDIYDQQDQKLLVGMEHHIQASDNVDTNTLKNLMVSYMHEFENSMVYYLGTQEHTFTDKQMKQLNSAKKTGRFAK